MLSIVRGQIENKKFIIFKNNKIIENLLIALYSEGLIHSFSLTASKFFTINLKYFGSSSIINKVTIYKKKSYSNSVTIKKLKKLIHKNPSSVFIINTSVGFLSQSEVLRYKILGILCFKIN